MKHITIVPAAGGAHRDVGIHPGTTPRDIRRHLGLDDTFILTLGRGAEAFGEEENIYPAVPDGAKLYASTPVEVGGIFDIWDILPRDDLVKSGFGGGLAQNVPPSSFHGSRAVVERQTDCYWRERGWTPCGWDRHEGYFRTRYGSWKGKAETSLSGSAKLYIRNPPTFLKEHSHWPCFRKRFDGWYYIHANHDHDLSSGILRVEEILNDAARRYL